MVPDVPFHGQWYVEGTILVTKLAMTISTVILCNTVMYSL